MKKQYFVYISIMILIMLVPFAGMSISQTTEETEKRELAVWPVLKTEDGINVHYLSDVGNWFEDHMAFRREMITAYAFLTDKIANYSPTDQVIKGTEGWLYFGGSAEDYMSTNQLSERELNNIVHNICLLQNYVESKGITFVLMLAPNKNTLYDDNMPYYYLKTEDSNLERLQERLSEEGVNYVDLVEAFQSSEEKLYFKRDTHWNNKGALLVYNRVLDYAGKPHATYDNCGYEIIKEHEGDLDALLYPAGVTKEENYVYDMDYTYSYVNEVTDNMDDWIQTYNAEGQETLLMYRDSFGESLLPFFAQAYANGYFSRYVPYNMDDLEKYQPDMVIVEKVERQLDVFGTEVPVMEGSRVDMEAYGKGAFSVEDTDTSINLKESGNYVLIGGTIDELYLTADSEIYVAVNGTLYSPFYTLSNQGDGNGYRLYLKAETAEDRLDISVFLKDGTSFTCVKNEKVLRS